MKDELLYVMSLLQSLEDRYFIRSDGEVAFKEAKNELQRLIDAPDAVVSEHVAVETVDISSLEIKFLDGLNEIKEMIAAASNSAKTASSDLSQ
jgi:hypothetical protein